MGVWLIHPKHSILKITSYFYLYGLKGFSYLCSPRDSSLPETESLIHTRLIYKRLQLIADCHSLLKVRCCSFSGPNRIANSDSDPVVIEGQQAKWRVTDGFIYPLESFWNPFNIPDHDRHEVCLFICLKHFFGQKKRGLPECLQWSIIGKSSQFKWHNCCCLVV